MLCAPRKAGRCGGFFKAFSYRNLSYFKFKDFQSISMDFYGTFLRSRPFGKSDWRQVEAKTPCTQPFYCVGCIMLHYVALRRSRTSLTHLCLKSVLFLPMKSQLWDALRQLDLRFAMICGWSDHLDRCCFFRRCRSPVLTQTAQGCRSVLSKLNLPRHHPGILAMKGCKIYNNSQPCSKTL